MVTRGYPKSKYAIRMIGTILSKIKVHPDEDLETENHNVHLQVAPPQLAASCTAT